MRRTWPPAVLLCFTVATLAFLSGCGGKRGSEGGSSPSVRVQTPDRRLSRGRRGGTFVRADIQELDTLNIVATRLNVLADLEAPAILTPHPGEFARLAGRTNEEVRRHRLELAPEFAAKHGVIVVLKGYRTLIASPDGRVFVNPTGNPGMATGGTGDVLGGMIASQIAQKQDVLGAALSAVFAHGLAGDVAADRLGERSLVAGDIIRCLPPALKALTGE